MITKFINWLEEDPARTRKVVLLSTVFVFLVITISVFTASFFGVIIQPSIVTIFGTLAAFMVGIYGFFTGTSSDKSAALADKAADIMMGNLKKIDKKETKKAPRGDLPMNAPKDAIFD